MGDGREGLNVTTVPASGHASHAYRTQDPKGGYRWARVTFDVEHAEIERLVKVLNENGFLRLAERYQGKDLHDGIIQSIYAVGLSLEDVPELMEEDPDESPDLDTPQATPLPA